jgi:hypothetical protein
MRRDVAIALLVIVPVAVLLVLSWREPETALPAPVPPAAPLQPMPAPAQPPRQPARVEEQLGEQLDAGRSSPNGTPQLPGALVANARQCLVDQRRQQTVEVRFTPTRDGRYVDVRATTQDPYLAACLEDVFEEARWTPSAAATERFEPTTFEVTR